MEDETKQPSETQPGTDLARPPYQRQIWVGGTSENPEPQTVIVDVPTWDPWYIPPVDPSSLGDMGHFGPDLSDDVPTDREAPTTCPPSDPSWQHQLNDFVDIAMGRAGAPGGQTYWGREQVAAAKTVLREMKKRGLGGQWNGAHITDLERIIDRGAAPPPSNWRTGPVIPEPVQKPRQVHESVHNVIDLVTR